jgi:hypothetical protein
MSVPSSSEYLVPWDVPFAEWKSAELYVIKEGIGSDLAILVAPSPMGELLKEKNYPKYLIRFDWVITFLYQHEACAPTERSYYKIPGWVQGKRFYQWINSPWSESYKGCFWSEQEEMHHYIMLTDSNIVEAISIGDARIEKIDSKQIIDVKYEA